MRFLHPSRSRLPSLLLIGLSLAACAAGRPASAQERPGGSAAGRLPVSAVLDSARLAQALQAATAPPADSTVQWAFAIRFTPAGTVDSVRPILHPDDPRPPSGASALVRVVEAHVLPQAARQGPWVYFVRAFGGSARPFELEVASERLPQLLNERWFSRMVGRFAIQLEAGKPNYARGTRKVSLLGVVTLDGKMVGARVAESSGDAATDQAALRLAELTLFEPGRIAGIPAPVLVTFPINFGS